MEYKWHFSDESSQSNKSVDKFADSKFSIDRWTSFTREIIQNSLDARDDENQPVKVDFDLNKQLTLDDIPGGHYTKSVLEKCVELASNKQTKQVYKKGVEILSKPCVYCLKVSDSNTIGVKTGRNEAWGALVFDEGITKKQRPGSAGSHGVGKKVPFIVSACNTVFYATKNKYKIAGVAHSDLLVQGKTALISWKDDNEVWKCSEGWFGKENHDATSPFDKILPLCNDEVDEVHPYFSRKDEFGTDVIMIGVNAYGIEEQIKKAIISSIYENFFVALRENILKVTVFGQEINNGNMDKVFRSYYEPTGTLKNSMNDLLRIYTTEPEILSGKRYNTEIGTVRLYFEAASESNKKYYTIVRNHGMKICEHYVSSADKAFSAVAIIEGDELNELLSSLENAAHDAFITDDPDIDYEDNAISAHTSLLKVIKNYILEQTKIDDGEDQKIEGLNEILSVPGFTPKITKKDSKAQIKRNKVNKKRKRKPNEPNPVPEPDPNPNPDPDPTPDPEPKPEPKKRKPTIEKFYDAYAFGPVLVKNDDGYLLRVMVKHDMKDCEFRIKSINSDEKVDSSIADLLVSATDGWKKYKFQDGCISKIKLSKDRMYEIQIKTSRDIKYRLTAELWFKEA